MTRPLYDVWVRASSFKLSNKPAHYEFSCMGLELPYSLLPISGTGADSCRKAVGENLGLQNENNCDRILPGCRKARRIVFKYILTDYFNELCCSL